jgi:lipoprotein NlpD
LGAAGTVSRLTLLGALCGALLATGCAHRARHARRAPEPQAQPGAFHTVQHGETLYRIARAYDVPLESIARENGLEDPARLEPGARLFIPGAARALEVAPAEPPAAARDEATSERGEAALPAARARGGNSRAVRAQQSAASRRQKPEQRANLEWPVEGVLFSPFGARARDQHDGIDLAAPEGTPVRASLPGTVLFAGQQRGYGNLILVGHDGDVVTVYAHNRENLVRAGDRVAQGAVIARVGRSGNATGPHLHFEVRVAARPQDPMHFLR